VAVLFLGKGSLIVVSVFDSVSNPLWPELLVLQFPSLFFSWRSPNKMLPCSPSSVSDESFSEDVLDFPGEDYRNVHDLCFDSDGNIRRSPDESSLYLDLLS
jgi:hypothetical protein